MAFTLLDWLILFLYFGVTMAIGLWFTGRQSTSDEFFLGSRRFGAFTISLSVLATGLSAITFIGTPGLACERDWSLFVPGAIGIAAMLVVAHFFMPFFYNLGLPSVYEYLQRRFDGRVAFLGGISFLAVRGLFAGIAIYAPSVALCAVAGWNLNLCIVLFGIMTIAYTAFGGMSAVVWTDVLQTFVLFGGAIVCIFVLFFSIPLTPGEMTETLMANDKFRVLDLRWSWIEMTFWTGIIGGFAYNLATYGTDQVMLQRCMASRSLKTAQQSLHLNAWYTIPVLLIFFILGSLLYLYRKTHPGAIPEGLPLDQIFPYYIAHNLPAGVSGLLIAAIFSAAMSTLSSILNSLSTVTVTDFMKKILLPGKSDADYTALAKKLTVLWGVIAICVAFFTNRLSESVALAALKVGGLITGPILGTFLLGIFFPNITPAGAFYGAIVGLAFSLLSGFLSPLDPFWVLCGSCLATMIVASIISVSAPFTTEERQARRGYTWFSRVRDLPER